MGLILCRAWRTLRGGGLGRRGMVWVEWGQCWGRVGGGEGDRGG